MLYDVHSTRLHLPTCGSWLLHIGAGIKCNLTCSTDSGFKEALGFKDESSRFVQYRTMSLLWKREAFLEDLEVVDGRLVG